jgi:hypothetical protein
MGSIEIRGITPEDFGREIENLIQKSRQDKYTFQVGLKDLDFDVDEDKLEESGSTLPFQSISQAETALSSGIIKPSTFIEHDDTIHSLIAFDPRPVGYSGFMDCVTHSIGLTDKGLFEVGRYPAMDLASSKRYWGWFLHRRLATSEEVVDWLDSNKLTNQELMNRVYVALTGL